MSSSNDKTLLLIGGGLAVAAVVTIFLLHKERFKNGLRLNKSDEIKRKKVPTNFLIYNYFPKHSIIVDVEEYSSLMSNQRPVVTTRLADLVLPKKTAGLTKQQVRDHLKGGNIIKIYVVSPSGERRHFTDYTINLDPDSGERIKALHVGMITTRFIGSTDGLRATTTSGNAISGNATLKIHNLSYIPLRLNGDAIDRETGTDIDPSSGGGIMIRPHSTERYLGYLHQGVTLGTIFSDDDGLYPDFQYLEPHSDLYYGIVSDLRQPLSGCWQLEFNDECDYGQTMWPFQENVL